MGVLAREVEAFRDTLRAWGETGRRVWAARPGLARATAIAFAAGATVAGAAALTAQLRLPSRLPSAQDWAALRALVERDARPGDAAVLSPEWAERARQVLPASLPILGGRRPAGEDLLGVRRVWIVSVPRAPGFSWGPEEELLRRGAEAARPTRIGALEISRLEISFPVLPLAFLPDWLAAAEGATVPARAVREVAGAPRPCLVGQAGDGAPLLLTFAPVRVGRLLRGHVGAVGAARLPGTVRVAVEVDGEEAGTAEITGEGFVPFQLDTTRFAGRPREISLDVRVSGPGGELCIDAATLP